MMLRVQVTFVQKGQGRGAFIDLKQWVQFRPWKKYSSRSLLFQNKNNHFYASSEKTQMKAVFMVAYERQTYFAIIKTQNIIIDFCELLMRSLWLDSASTNKSFNLYYFRFLAVKRQIQHQNKKWSLYDHMIICEHIIIWWRSYDCDDYYLLRVIWTPNSPKIEYITNIKAWHLTSQWYGAYFLCPLSFFDFGKSN